MIILSANFNVLLKLIGGGILHRPKIDITAAVTRYISSPGMIAKYAEKPI